jgi:hypothetical protein
MNDRELIRVFEKLAGPRPAIVTLVPYKRELVSPAPRMQVFWTYSELVPPITTEQLAEVYFAALSRAEIVSMLKKLATVNNMLLNQDGRGSGLHDNLNRDLVGAERRKEMGRQRAEQREHEPAMRVVFHRLAVLLNMKLLLGLRDHGSETTNDIAGEIALLANNFISEESYESNQDLILEALPTWEISNPRDVAYSMSRYDFFIRDYLLGADQQIATLREKTQFERRQI